MDSSFAASVSQSQIRPYALRFYSEMLRRCSRSCPEFEAPTYEVGQFWNSLKQDFGETTLSPRSTGQALNGNDCASWRGDHPHLNPLPSRERRGGMRARRPRSQWGWIPAPDFSGAGSARERSKSPTTVIPAQAGIHPRQGALSLPWEQSVTRPAPIRW